MDEAQHVPELFSYLQGIVDASPENGRYILTGSQNFLLNEKITQSLAGRIGMTTLLPFSMAELGTPSDMNKNIFQGGYPRLYAQGMTPEEFFPSYINTYVERDVRQIINIENVLTFQKFMQLCAGRVGQVINLTSLAQDCGISNMTARRWFMDNHTCFNQTLKDLKLAHFVLTNNLNYVVCTELGCTIYRQMVGTAMGASFSVVYTVIFNDSS